MRALSRGFIGGETSLRIIQFSPQLELINLSSNYFQKFEMSMIYMCLYKHLYVHISRGTHYFQIEMPYHPLFSRPFLHIDHILSDIYY